MHYDAIRRLPIADIAAPDAELALRFYGPMLPKAVELMDSRGFIYKSDLRTWAGKPAIGTGRLSS
jgi:N6-adenosine-specific RNA methylase IME4